MGNPIVLLFVTTGYSRNVGIITLRAFSVKIMLAAVLGKSVARPVFLVHLLMSPVPCQVLP